MFYDVLTVIFISESNLEEGPVCIRILFWGKLMNSIVIYILHRAKKEQERFWSENIPINGWEWHTSGDNGKIFGDINLVQWFKILPNSSCPLGCGTMVIKWLVK